MIGLKVLFDDNILLPNMPIAVEDKGYATRAALVLECTPRCLAVLHVTTPGNYEIKLIPIEEATSGKVVISPLICSTENAIRAEYMEVASR